MKTLALIAMSAAVLSLGACSSWNPAHKAPGKYESSSKTTTSSGTTYKTNKTTDVEVDQYGNKRAVVETETTKDPEGLMNKSTTTTKKTYHE